MLGLKRSWCSFLVQTYLVWLKFILLHFIKVAFSANSRQDPPPVKKDCDSLNCYSHFIVVVWNQTYNTSEICLYIEVINSEISLDSESERNRGQWWEYFLRVIFSNAVIFKLGTTVYSREAIVQGWCMLMQGWCMPDEAGAGAMLTWVTSTVWVWETFPVSRQQEAEINTWGVNSNPQRANGVWGLRRRVQGLCAKSEFHLIFSPIPQEQDFYRRWARDCIFPSQGCYIWCCHILSGSPFRIKIVILLVDHHFEC